TVGVRVIALHQALVVLLNGGDVGRPRQPESGEGLALQCRRSCPDFGPRRARAMAILAVRLVEQAEAAVERVPVAPAASPELIAAQAERPERPLAEHRRMEMRLDLFRAHAGVIVPGLVVGLHVLEAEPVILPELPARLGRAVISRLLAAGMVAVPRMR